MLPLDSSHTIPEALAFWAEQTPDALALRSLAGHDMSFQELFASVTNVRDQLQTLGIERDNRVALILPPGVDACIALLGTMAAAVAVPFHLATAAPELCRDLARLDPRLLVTSDPPTAACRAASDNLGVPTITVAELTARNEAEPQSITPLLPLSAESIAVILHTSGTTGLPKRVPRTHGSFVACARAAQRCSALTPDDVLLLTSSLHTNSGVANLCCALLNGGSCVATTGFDPDAFPDWLENYQPTWMVSTAAELNMILAAADAAGREAVAGPRSRLRLVRAGAQPMTPGTAERAEASLRALILDGFGMTEASYITASGPTAEDRREGSCGPPWCTEIRVLDARGEDLPSGAPGEIVIRGETLFAGYLDDPETNAAVFLPGGWFRTGDLGYVDEDGYLYLIGRMNELINRGGEKIAPVEVDRALQTHPAIAEAATFAVPDARLGEDIVAAVVFKPGSTATARELRGWLLQRLTSYKVPRRIWVIDRLPRTATGKVQRGVLAERFLASR